MNLQSALNLYLNFQKGGVSRAGQGGTGKWGRGVLSIPWVIEIYNSDKTVMFKSGVVEPFSSVISQTRRESQADPCRFEVSPVYRVKFQYSQDYILHYETTAQ